MLSKLFRFPDERSFSKQIKALNCRYENTSNMKTVRVPIPKQVRIHMDQHQDSSCVPVVKKGDEIKVGQVIATCHQSPATFIHASVSGKVTKVEDVLLRDGIKTKEVIIEADGLQEIDPMIQPPLIHDKQDFMEALENAGIIELTNHAFLKATKDGAKNMDTLLINATTWEPFVTMPIREILEQPADVLNGMVALMKHLNMKEGIIGIERHQTEVITCLQEILTAESQKYAHISLKTLSASYPKGADSQFIQACKKGLLEDDVLVLSGGAVAELSRYLKTGMPVITVGITVNGSAISEPKNVLAPIGTPIKDIIDFCGGYKETPRKILLGGLLMGTAVLNDDTTVSKQTMAVLALGKKEAEVEEETDCIRCGRCMDVCPVNLLPVLIDQAVRFNQLDELKNLNVAACIQCGSCSFICPASRHLVQTIHVGKALLKKQSYSKT